MTVKPAPIGAAEQASRVVLDAEDVAAVQRLVSDERVFAFFELHARPFVVNVDHVGVVHDLLHERGRNEVDTLGVSDHEIARHDRRLANPHRNVDATDDHVGEIAGMRAPKVRRHIHS